VGGGVPEEAERAGCVFAQAGGGAEVEIVLVAAHTDIRDRETGRQGDRETGRQGDKETGRQGDKETRRQGDRETGRQGDGETGRRGDFTIHNSQFIIENSSL
jgi:hypothetical protein